MIVCSEKKIEKVIGENAFKQEEKKQYNTIQYLIDHSPRGAFQGRMKQT